MVGDFHQQGDARCAVVGARNGIAWRTAVDLFVGMRAGVVVGPDHDAIEPLGVP